MRETKVKKERNIKKRNWAFVLYPESAPSDWQELLKKTGLPAAISPLHDKDVEADKTEKKAHYHVIVCYSGPTSYNVVKRLTDGLKQPRPEPLEQVKGYYRYFTHRDDPQKHQYSEKDIVTLNGFSILDYYDLTKSQVLTYLKSLQHLIKDNDFLEYSDFMDFLLENDLDTEYDIASSHTYFFERYISSRRNKLKGLKTNDSNRD